MGTFSGDAVTTLTDLPVSLKQAEQAVVGAADVAVNSVQGLIDSQIEKLLAHGAGTETRGALIEPLLHLLRQKVEAEAVRASVGEALAQIVLASGQLIDDKEMRAAAFDIALHFLRSSDQIAVAAVCGFAIQVGKDLDGLLASLGTMAKLSASFFMTSPLFLGQLGKPTLEGIVALGKDHPELASAAEIAKHLLVVPEMEDALIDAFKEILAQVLQDPIQLLIDGGAMVAGILQVLAELQKSSDLDFRALVAEMRRDPMAVGEALGVLTALVVIEVLFLVLGPEDLLLAVGRRAGPVLRFLGDVARMQDRLAFERFFRPKLLSGLDVDALRDLVRALIRVSGSRIDYQISVKAMNAIRTSKILTPALKALFRDELVPHLLQAAIDNFFRMAPYGRLKQANEVVHADLFILHALEIDGMLPQGQKEYTRAMRVVSGMSMREEWYEAAHIVDARLLEGVPAWKEGFELLGWQDRDAMPALNVPSSRHTMSIRRALIRLAKSKGMALPLVREDIAADAFSITDVMNRNIVIKGHPNAEAFRKTAKLYIDPARPGKLSAAFKATLEVWQGDQLAGGLTPEAEEMLRAAIATLERAGR